MISFDVYLEQPSGAVFLTRTANEAEALLVGRRRSEAGPEPVTVYRVDGEKTLLYRFVNGKISNDRYRGRR